MTDQPPTRATDDPYHEWSPIVARPPLRWPGGAALAVSVVVVCDSVDARQDRRPVAPGGMGPRPFPDLARISHHEYGLRVGVFRVLDALDEIGVRPTVALDLATARRADALLDILRSRADEVVAAGRSASEPLTSDLAADEERSAVVEVIDGIEAALRRRPRGWMGPGYAESHRTPAVLAEAGLRYVCDWANDEQPSALGGGARGLVSLPVALELDTEHALWERRLTVEAWARTVEAATARLVRDGQRGGRSLVLVLRPWLVGQPFRIGTLRRVLGALQRRDVWCAPAGEVVAAWDAARR